jgi:hypothetical protein
VPRQLQSGRANLLVSRLRWEPRPGSHHSGHDIFQSPMAQFKKSRSRMECHQRRAALLARLADEGKPSPPASVSVSARPCHANCRAVGRRSCGATPVRSSAFRRRDAISQKVLSPVSGGTNQTSVFHRERRPPREPLRLEATCCCAWGHLQRHLARPRTWLRARTITARPQGRSKRKIPTPMPRFPAGHVFLLQLPEFSPIIQMDYAQSKQHFWHQGK